MWQAATGDESQFKWIKQSGPFNQFNVLASGNVPVAYVFKSPFVRTLMMSFLIRGGFEIINNGYDLKVFYLARALCPGSGMTPGKVSEGAVGKMVPNRKSCENDTDYVQCYSATVSYRGKENIHSEYEVLVYTGPPS